MIALHSVAPTFAADSPLGDGAIDNYIVDSSVHVTMGVIVLVTMAGCALRLIQLAIAGRPVDRSARVLLAAAQISLAVQALLGIKMLDQGQGVVQLYIHYIGGLAPLGFFLAAGWFAWRSEVRRTRVLAVLTTLGLVSAFMAFTIGQEYANQGA